MSLTNHKIIQSVGLKHNRTIARAESTHKTLKPSTKRLGYSHQQREQLVHILLELR